MKNLPASNASWMSTSFDDLLTQNDRPVVDLYHPEDTIRGTPGDDTLTGTAGDDKLNGWAGADSMIGGLGNDTYAVDDVGDVVVEFEGGGGGWDGPGDWVYATIDYVLGDHVEGLKLKGNADLEGVGNRATNIMVGNAGDNRLDGGAGNDILYGGAGDDTLEASGLAWNGEILYGEAGNDHLRSHADSCRQYGGQGNDTLQAFGEDSEAYGGAGDDLIDSRGMMYGGAGNDTVIAGGSPGSGLFGGDGDDLMDNLGGGAPCHFHGDGGNDTLLGGNSLDRLWGGAGHDRIDYGMRAYGEGGADTFLRIEVIGDFQTGQDRMILAPAGDGDGVVEGAVTIAAPGGFSAAAELVIATHATTLSDKNLIAAALGSATEAYAAGQTAVFVVTDGTSSEVYRFTSSGADAVISAGELLLRHTLEGAEQTAIADYLFSG